MLDNYLECGQDVSIAFSQPPLQALGSTKARKLDKDVWAGRFATPPARFEKEIPPTSLCAVLPTDPRRPPPIALDDLGTYAKYDKNIRAYKVYFRLEDTSKAARRNFNGIAHLAPPLLDEDWCVEGDSEADLTGVRHSASTRAHRVHLPLESSENSTALQPHSHVTSRGAETFRHVLCGMSADGYFEYDLLSGVEPSTRDRILAAIHPARRAPQSDYLTPIPCGILFVHGPPGCGKSAQLAGAIVLAIAQGKPVLLMASRHEAVDACLKKVEALVQTSGLDCVIIRVFDAAEDESACKRVLFERDDWRSSPFRIRLRWRPRLSIAFWVGYFLGIEPSPWTGRCLDAATSPECFQDALSVARQINSSPADLPVDKKSRLYNTFNVYVDKCIDHVFQSALLVAATPCAALGKMAKWFTRNQAAVLAVDEAAAIDESHVMQ